MSNDPVEEQLADWRRALEQNHPLEPVEVAKRVLGQKFLMAVPTRLGENGFDPKVGIHPVLKVVPKGGTDITEFSGQLKEELDKVSWQLVTKMNAQQGVQRRFAMAPITLREANITFHTTRASALAAILRDGLVPSNPSIRQTDFPDTDGKIHVCESLEGIGSASRWVNIFCTRYNRKPEDNGILRVDLTGLTARIYQDVRSEFGLIVDRIDRIPHDRIRLERLGQEADCIIPVPCE
jgi:hypothetical protein